jgi:outer membrane protein assembly factor BamD (BamD/ComL family)
LTGVTSQHRNRRKRRGGNRPRRAWLLGLPLGLCLGASGCTWDVWNLNKPELPPAPAESLVLHGDALEADKPPADSKVAADMAGAHEYYRRGEYDKARRLFRAVADNEHNPPAVAEEARYYQAECLRQEGYYPDAADYFTKLLNDFPAGSYREQAMQHLFDIANYWLDDTRKEMRQDKEKADGKRWFVDQHFVNFLDKTRPHLDEEGHAIDKLEQVSVNAAGGPLGDKALFLMGSVKFFNEDYREADRNFSQLVESYPNSTFAPQAIELAIVSKNLSTGGSDYDGRKVAEARRLVDIAFRNYPELARQKEDRMMSVLGGITVQQAEKDYKIAEFYKRTGHPESAYFYYEIVRRRYPGTKYFDLATQRMNELREQAEKAGKKVVPDAGTPDAGTAQVPHPNPGAELAPPPRKLPDQLR